MDRRGFFKLFGAGVAGIALEQAIPLGRVWSFPSKIVLPKPWQKDAIDLALRGDYTAFRVGDTIRIVIPQRWVVRDLISQDIRAIPPVVPLYKSFIVAGSKNGMLCVEPYPQKNDLDL